jgi:hypothetical protein
MCQDHKDFNKEIKNIRHDLMFNVYPQEFSDSMMKPSRSNLSFRQREHPTSTNPQLTVIKSGRKPQKGALSQDRLAD